MTPEAEIKKLGIKHGAELAGIASVTDINRYAPSGHRPDDILIGAKSVVVFAGQQFPRGTWRSPDYRIFSANYDFIRIRSLIAMKVAKFIESRYGYYSLADVPPHIGLNPSLSLKLCAEMAGLGTRSMAGGVILNPELGLINVTAIVTTMPLIADGPMKEPVCPHPSCVKLWERNRSTPCLEACPNCLSGELEGERIKWMRYDRRICSTRCHNLSGFSFLSLLQQAAEEPDPEVRRSMLLGSHSRNAIDAICFGRVIAECSQCLRNCPICIRGRSLKVKDVEVAKSVKNP